MPPKKVTVATLPAGQQSIQFLFQKPSRGSGATKSDNKPIVGTPDVVTIPAVGASISGETENPEIQAFYVSLSPAEKIAHTIAYEKLGTSYDVTRTHGFLKWKKTLK